MTELFCYVACIAFAIAPLTIAIRLRDVVKVHRLGIIKELAKFFVPPAGTQDDIIHSFEFVKFKYESQDFQPMDWFVPSLFLIGMLIPLNAFGALIVAATTGLEGIPDPFAIVPVLQSHSAWSWSFLAAYCGAYVFLSRALVQAINNFDLTPDSLYGALVNLFLGLAMPQIAFFAFSQLAPATSPVVEHVTTGAAIILSFTAGYLPEAVLRETFRRTSLSQFKRANISIYHNFVSTPVEVIDGIDSEIRDRLKDFHISTVQNLATVNPIMLFVEMPYGIYELIDWVAQAQLCASVGSDALTRMWSLGLRTIFDLEQLGQSPAGSNTALLTEVGGIILPASRNASARFTEDEVKANIRIRLNNIHVHRLRQIVIRVGDKLGSQNMVLPPLFACDGACRTPRDRPPGAVANDAR